MNLMALLTRENVLFCDYSQIDLKDSAFTAVKRDAKF